MMESKNKATIIGTDSDVSIEFVIEGIHITAIADVRQRSIHKGEMIGENQFFEYLPKNIFPLTTKKEIDEAIKSMPELEPIMVTILDRVSKPYRKPE